MSYVLLSVSIHTHTQHTRNTYNQSIIWRRLFRSGTFFARERERETHSVSFVLSFLILPVCNKAQNDVIDLYARTRAQ